MSAKLCKRKRNDTADYREDREIKIIRNRVCAQTRSLANRGHIERSEKNRNGGIIYIKTRPKPFPCKKTIKLESAWRKNRFDVFPVPPLLFCPAILPCYFASPIPRKQDDKKSKRKSFRIRLNRTSTEKAARKF